MVIAVGRLLQLNPDTILSSERVLHSLCKTLDGRFLVTLDDYTRVAQKLDFSPSRLSVQSERREENLRRQLTWARRFDQPGAGRKEKVFPSAQRRESGNALLEELPDPKPRTRTLPPSETKVTAAKKAKKHCKKRREKRRKAEKPKKATRGPPLCFRRQRWARLEGSFKRLHWLDPCRDVGPVARISGLSRSCRLL